MISNVKFWLCLIVFTWSYLHPIFIYSHHNTKVLSTVPGQHSADWCTAALSIRFRQNRNTWAGKSQTRNQQTEKIQARSCRMTKRMQWGSSFGLQTWWRSCCRTWTPAPPSTWCSPRSVASSSTSRPPLLPGRNWSTGPFLLGISS